jgi:hypothetical protein
MLARDKHSSLLDPFVSYAKMKCYEYTHWGLYSHKLLKYRAVFTTLYFLCTYKLDQETKLLHYSRLEMLARDKHSSLLDLFISSAKNDML